MQKGKQLLRSMEMMILMEAGGGDRKRAKSPWGDNSKAQTWTEDHDKAVRRRRRRRRRRRQLPQKHPDDQRIGNTSTPYHHGDDAEEYCSSSSSSGYVLNNNEEEEAEEERLIFDFPWLKEGPISNADDYKLLLEENAFFGSPSSNDHLLLLHDHDHHREQGELLASASFCSSCGNGGGLEQKAADRANMVDASSLRGAGELEGPDWICSSVFDQPVPSAAAAAAGLDKYN